MKRILYAILGIAVLWGMAACGSSSKSSTSSSSGTPTSTDVSAAFTAYSAGISSAISGTSTGIPTVSPAEAQPPAGSSSGGTAVTPGSNPLSSGGPARLQGVVVNPPPTPSAHAFSEAAKNLVTTQAGGIRPTAAYSCNTAYTHCTASNAAGTVVITFDCTTSACNSATETIAFNGYTYSNVTINGTLTESLTCTSVYCDTFTSSFTGTLNISGSGVSTDFSIVFNETESYNGTTFTCGGYISVGGTTYYLSSNCGISTTQGSSPATYTIGGSVTGLSGTLVLQDNGTDNLTLTASGSFTFATALNDGSSYSVTVLTQPSGQTCTVSNGSGTLSGANVTNVAVSCSTSTTGTGTLMMWTLDGIDGTIAVTIDGSSWGTLTQYAITSSTSAGPSCPTNNGYAISKTVSAGSHSIHATSTGRTWSDTVTVAANQCVSYGMYNGTLGQGGLLMIWNNSYVHGNVQSKVDGLNWDLFTGYYSSQPTCPTTSTSPSGAFSMAVSTGSHSISASATSTTWGPTIYSVPAVTCYPVELLGP